MPALAEQEREELTHDRLKELLRYDPINGVMVWAKSRPGCRLGGAAGTMHADGYLIITVDKRHYRRSRLAWLYMTGKMPENTIDHKDRDRSNDRWFNLREATTQEQNRNRGRQFNNTSSAKGVCWHKNRRKWCAQITLNGKNKHLGLFTNFNDAVKAAEEARKKHFGEFSAAGYEVKE